MKKILPLIKTWQPSSWKSLPIKQSPDWPSNELVEAVKKLESFPPLIPFDEIDSLKKQFKRVSDDKAFILIAGDCAETFSDFNQSLIEKKLQIIFQMSLILGYGLEKPIIKIARLAGQFAKPRSSNMEIKGKVCLPSYMGDAVNSKDFDYKSRLPNPDRLIRAYYHSATTLNVLRSLTEKNITEMIGKWNDEKINKKALLDDIKGISKIEKAINLLNKLNQKNNSSHIFSKDFFTAHEALLLDYEQSLTKKNDNSKWYDCSSHFVWLGYRTGQPNNAHVEFLSGIQNPIGIKIGPSTNLDDLIHNIIKLNPENEKGKILLMPRYGIANIKNEFNKLIQIILENKLNVLWVCDPMHGNTYKTNEGYKTRDFNDIKKELKYFFEILNLNGLSPSGVHFELTPENVTECIGESYNIKQSNIHEKYETACDPRLNNNQSLDIAFSINKLLKG